MKKLILTILILTFVLMANTVGAITVADYFFYEDSDYVDWALMYTPRTKYGQTFQVLATTTLNSAKFYINKTGSPTDDIYVKVYNTTGTHGEDAFPVGAPIATSTAISATTVTSGDLELVSFPFTDSNKILLTPNVTYGLSIEPNNITSPNYIRAGIVSVGGGSLHAGNYFGYRTDTGIWNSDYSGDYIFYVYVDDIPTVSMTSFNSNVQFKSGNVQIK